MLFGHWKSIHTDILCVFSMADMPFPIILYYILLKMDSVKFDGDLGHLGLGWALAPEMGGYMTALS